MMKLISGTITRWEYNWIYPKDGESRCVRSISAREEVEWDSYETIEVEGEKIFEKFHVSPMQPENEEIGPIERHKSIYKNGDAYHEIYRWDVKEHISNGASKDLVTYYQGETQSTWLPNGHRTSKIAYNGVGSFVEYGGVEGPKRRVTSGKWVEGKLQKNTNQLPIEFLENKQ